MKKYKSLQEEVEAYFAYRQSSAWLKPKIKRFKEKLWRKRRDR